MNPLAPFVEDRPRLALALAMVNLKCDADLFEKTALFLRDEGYLLMADALMERAAQLRERIAP